MCTYTKKKKKQIKKKNKKGAAEAASQKKRKRKIKIVQLKRLDTSYTIESKIGFLQLIIIVQNNSVII